LPHYDAFWNLAAEYGAVTKPSCTTCYVSWDHLGSVRMLTDGSGNVVARHDYLPFGEEIPANTAGRNSQWGLTADVDTKFTGQIRDNETGMDYFNARYLTGALGRFNSSDPLNLGADATDPQTWNGYAYVRNNPLALVDPMGLCTFDAEGNAVEDENGACYEGGFGGSVTVTASLPPDVMPIFVSLPSLLSDTQQPMQSAPPAVTETGVGIKPPKNGTQSCVAPNFLQRAGIAVQAGIARFFNKTIGVGAGGSIGAGNIVGVSLSVSRQVVVASNGQAAFATSVSAFTGHIFNSATTPGYGGYGGIQFSLSNARNVNDLGGSALDYGFGGGSGWGGGIDFATDLQTSQATVTLGGGFGGYGHGLTNVTTSITPICGN
jgi:RHS repeat-associated protein